MVIYQKESDLIWNKYSCLENSMDRGVWQAAVHVVTKQRVGYDWATVSPSLFYFLMLRGGAWCATVHGVTKTWTQSSKWTTNACCFLVTQWCPTLQPHALQHPTLPCPSPSHRACSNLCYWLGNASNYLILCCTLLILASIFPRNRIFSNEFILRIRCPKHWSFSFSICDSNEYSGLISFRID